MKKTLCLLLAVLIVACSFPAFITSYADDSVNLLADATNANGAVTWDSDIDVRNNSIDSKSESVYGSPSWTFGLGLADHNTEDYKRVYIKASGLKVGTNYDFSFIYQKDYKFAIESIKNANGGNADYTNPATVNVPDKERSYKVSTAFTVPSDGDYTITLITGRCASMRASDCSWDVTVLSDLSLTKTAEAINYLKDATNANGDVTWTTTTNVDNRIGNLDAWGGSNIDNTDNSVNGGYSWVFGLGDGMVGGDNTYIEAKYKETFGYIYIKAKGLEANTRYQFSYIYQEDYIIFLDSVTDSDSAVVELESPATTENCTAKARSYQVSATFKAPKDGDYTIALKTNRANRTSDCKYSRVILSDLVLIKSTAAAKVATEVLVSGNGDATVSNAMTAIGSQVTYTAAPWQDEEFLGWYNGDEKISESLVYSFAVTEKVTLTAKFTSKSLNVLAGKKASDWTGWHWLKVSDSSESKSGGKGYLLNSVMWQSMYTTVTLKPNTEYDFSFNWKGIANDKGPAFPSEIMVYPVNAADIEDRANNWSDGGDGGQFQPKTGTDLEQGSGYASEDMAKTYQWQSINTGFTTTSETDYNVIVYFTIDSGTPGEQAINVSDFVLKEKGAPVVPPVTPDEDAELSEKDASDWTGYEHAKIENSNESKDGGKGYLVNDAMYQSVYTKLNLKANTEYKLSFNWKAVQNDVCPAYPAAIKVYSASAADIEDRATNWSDGGNFTPPNATDLEQGGGYASEDMAKTYQWQSISTGFTTTADTEYNLVILFTINGGANHQAVNLSDFVLEEVGGSQEPQTPPLSEKDATDWSCYQWSSIENSDVSRYGGKAYLVKKAMYQNIYTSLTLKPNTKYTLSFEWKSVANDKGPAFPNDIFVVSKNDIDVEDKDKNWIDSDFQAAIYDLEIGGKINAGNLAETLQWQNTTVTFNTKDDTEYTLLIHFQTNGNGDQEIYLSDFKLEDGGPSVPDENQDPDNLAAKYTAASGNVTWTENAGLHFADSISDIGGGYSWGFGIPSTNFDGGIGDTGVQWDPAYVNIKTHELEAGHKYEFSYIFQKDFLIVFDSIDSDAKIIKTEDVKLLEGDRAHRITITFTTTKAGAHNIKLKMGKGRNNENCQWDHTVLCDLKLYDISNRVYGTVKSELGGTATGFDMAYCTKGDEITLIATPRPGNTFVGWFDAENNLVSSDATFVFTAENDFNYLAVFSGTNVPNGEWLEQHGMDGTFENGTMTGWKAEDRDNGDPTDWQSFERSDFISYNGNYALKFNSRYRTTFFRFNDLKSNTDYFLSFYVNLPDTLTYDDPELEEKDKNAKALIKWFSITSGGATLYSDNTTCAIPGGSGWYKVNIYFNTGAYETVDWNFYFTNKDGQPTDTVLKQFVYMDDIKLIEYKADSLKNGNFETGASPWCGEFDVNDGVAKIAAGKNAYQNVNLTTQSLYTVSFKAKGKGKAGVSVLTTNDVFSLESQISSESAVNVDSADWKEYSFNVYSGIHPAGSIFFETADGELFVDDVVITKQNDRSGAIVEKIDFETDRFALHNKSGVFEIYNGTAGDANVHSGTKSLRFNSAKAEAGVEYLFDEAFLSSQIVPKLNYRLTLYYKTTKGNTIYIAPEYLKNIIDSDVQTTYTATGNGWTKVDFIFNKNSIAYIKTLIGNILNKTNGDFYIDDITLSITPPMVIETNSANKYCEWPLNVLNNQGFEDKITNNDWANLPGTTELRTDKGAAGDNYLRVKAGTHYVLPVKVDASDNYYFSISTRLGKNSSGYVAVATNPEGTEFYNDINGVTSSKIAVDSEKWNRDSFLFSTGETGMVYIVFAVNKGYIDIDEVHLYKRQYGKETDPNDHTDFVPYNYDNPDPSTVVLNGGDPTFSGNEVTEEDESPETGDNRATPATVLVVTALAAMILVITAKRTRKISKGGKAQ